MKPSRTPIILISVLCVLCVAVAVRWRLRTPDDAEGPTAVSPAVPSQSLMELSESHFPDLNQETLTSDRQKQRDGMELPFGIPLAEREHILSWSDLHNRRRKFLQRMTDQYYEPFKANGELTPQGEVIAVWLNSHATPDAYNDEGIALVLNDYYQRLVEDEKSHPVMELMRGEILFRQKKFRDATDVLATLVSRLDKVSSSGFLQMWTESLIYRSEKQLKLGKQIQTVNGAEGFTDAALSFLREIEQSPDDYRYAWQLVSDGLGHLNITEKESLCRKAFQVPGISPWLMHMLVGKTFEKLAWDARGVGFAHTVTTQGSEGFQKNLSYASLHFQAAWLLRTDIPFAAYEMIMISRAHGDAWNPRDWFDLVVSAQNDYRPAFDRYLHVIRPRWGGSVEQMIDFGLECAATKDFENGIADFLINTITIAKRDYESQPSVIWGDKRLRVGLQKLWQAYDDALENGYEPGEYRLHEHLSWRAALAWHFDDMSLLKNTLDRLDTSLASPPFVAYFNNERVAVSMVYAAIGENGRQVREFEQQFSDRFNRVTNPAILQMSLEMLEQAAEECREEARFYFAARSAMLQRRIRFYRNEWVELDFDNDLAAWKVDGRATVEDSQTMVVSNVDRSSHFASLRPSASFPPPYQVMATIERILGDEFIQTIGIDVGNFRGVATNGVGTGRSFVMRNHPNTVGVVTAGRRDVIFRMKNLEQTVDIRVRVWRRDFRVQFNSLEIPVTGNDSFRGTHLLAFGGSRKFIAYGAVRISNVRIHRLPWDSPISADASLKERDRYHSRIAEFDPNDAINRVRLASVRHEQNRWAETIQHVENAYEIRPDIPEIYPLLVSAHLKSGDLVEARKGYETMLKAQPNKQEYLNHLAWICATAEQDDLRDPDRALQIAANLCRQEPDNWQYRLTLSAALAESGDFAAATTAFARVIESSPADPHGHLSQFQATLDQGLPIRHLAISDAGEEKNDTSAERSVE